MSNLKDGFSAFVAGWCFAFAISIGDSTRWICFGLGVLNLLNALRPELYSLFADRSERP